jgi:hypothetical protein
MKHIPSLSALFLLLNLSTASAQSIHTGNTIQNYPMHKLTIEPAIGLNPYAMGDFLISNVVKWDIKTRLSLVSYTSYTHNQALQRDFNHIRTDYNYSINQKFGVGTSLYSKRSSHTFSLMAGVKYDAFKETLHNPEFETVSASVSSVSPDFGLMYHMQKGLGKWFFSYRMYVPLYPYPFGRADITAITGNLSGITMEFGVGVNLK